MQSKADNDYRFEYVRNEKGHIVEIKTVFHRSFLRERRRSYDPRANKYVSNNLFS